MPTTLYHGELAPQGKTFPFEESAAHDECFQLALDGWVDTPAKFPGHDSYERLKYEPAIKGTTVMVTGDVKPAVTEETTAQEDPEPQTLDTFMADYISDNEITPDTDGYDEKIKEGIASYALNTFGLEVDTSKDVDDLVAEVREAEDAAA